MTEPNRELLRKAIADVRFPCEHDDLIHQAAASGADDDTLGHLHALPHNRYDDADAVVTACGQLRTE